MKLLRECQILRNRLQECSVNFLAEEEDKFTVDSTSLSDALDLLTTSDNRIGLLLAEVSLCFIFFVCLQMLYIGLSYLLFCAFLRFLLLVVLVIQNENCVAND